MTGISLIMATAGRTDEINCFINSLESQKSALFELIVVDQNKDGFLSNILFRLSNSSIVTKHVPISARGLSIARNVGFHSANYPIVAYPDDDCSYEEDVVLRALECFEKNPDLDGLVGRWCEKDLLFDSEFDLDGKTWLQFREGISGFSSCLFMRKDLVEMVGGFDERLGVPQWFGAGEETDFVLRCLLSGAKIRYLPSIRIHHPVKSAQKGLTFQHTRKRSRGAGALYRKHRMSPYVIVRGLLSPFLKSFIPPFSAWKIKANCATLLGRIEGMVFWKD